MIFDQKETTSVRGMAILMIAIFHLFIAWEWPRVVNLPGSVGVAAFLFLSGYGINESYKKTGLKEYWRKELRRVMIPFWLFVTILFFFKQTSNWHDLEMYLVHMTFVNSTSTSWQDILTFIGITTIGTWIFYQVNHRIIKKWI